MKGHLQELQALKIPIDQMINGLVSAGLAYKIDAVEYRLLDSLDVVIHIERSLSLTEKMLIQQHRSGLAQEIGLIINLVLKNKLAFALSGEFNLSVAHISFLQPTLRQKFALLVLLDP